MINEIARPFLIGASGCDIVVDELWNIKVDDWDGIEKNIET